MSDNTAKAGDIVRVQVNVWGSIQFAEFKLEEFHHCLGFFATETAKRGSVFTPLCAMIEPEHGYDMYIPNHGVIHTKFNKTYDIYKDDCKPVDWVGNYNDGDVSDYI